MESAAVEKLSTKNRHRVGALSIAPELFEFVENELLPEIGVEAAEFWRGLESIVSELTPTNRALLERRDRLQAQIDEWHLARKGKAWSHDDYVAFLKDIGYLEDAGDPFTIETANVDAEIAEIAGPQLVVPVSNARFAINAANARWGSLYDALYGTDVISEENDQQRDGPYNPTRGAAVIRYATEFLDRVIPLAGVSHADVNDYGIDRSDDTNSFVASLANGEAVHLEDTGQFVGLSEDGERRSYLFRNNGLHIEIQVDPDHAVGRDATGNVSDVILESAVTTIQDCEDSVAAVDAQDKAAVYRNWLGLMKAELEATLEKGGKTLVRRPNADRMYTGVDGEPLALSGRSLLLVRNVGHLMTTDAVLDDAGDEIFEGLLDAVMTTACALTDRRRDNHAPNSRTGSIYIVKPKMH